MIIFPLIFRAATTGLGGNAMSNAKMIMTDIDAGILSITRDNVEIPFTHPISKVIIAGDIESGFDIEHVFLDDSAIIFQYDERGDLVAATIHDDDTVAETTLWEIETGKIDVGDYESMPGSRLLNIIESKYCERLITHHFDDSSTLNILIDKYGVAHLDTDRYDMF